MENDIVRMLFLRRQRQKKRWKTKTISGAPPLTYKARAGALKDYRIYGNTVGGESVGDRTGNLFDGEFLQGYWTGSNGNFVASNKWICTNKFKCKPSITYTFSFNTLSRWYGIAWYDSNGMYISSSISQESTTQKLPIIYTATSPANAAYFAVNIAGYPYSNDSILPTDVTDLMLVESSTALPYEPYGYRVPMTISNGTDTLTTPIYLPEQIKMVGDEAEYVDYKEQKQHFADGTSVDVTLPALPTLSGTNTLTVGTEVQPSGVEITGRIKKGE